MSKQRSGITHKQSENGQYEAQKKKKGGERENVKTLQSKLEIAKKK